MNNPNGIIKIAYFSGTGNSKIVAKCFDETFQKHGCNTILENISSKNNKTNNHFNKLVLIFPVHAFNAPKPVYEWIDELNSTNNKSVIVISVSAGGEVLTNTACRQRVIKKLKRKGFDICYEEMIVMLSNWAEETEQNSAILLIKALPKKVERIVNDTISGVVKSKKPLLIDRLISHLGEVEKVFTGWYGSKIRVSTSCNKCLWCVNNCPVENIKLDDGKIKFNKKCCMCFKCFYGCPQKALTPGVFKSFVIKQGFNIKKTQNIAQNSDIKLSDINENNLWNGIKKYLNED